MSFVFCFSPNREDRTSACEAVCFGCPDRDKCSGCCNSGETWRCLASSDNSKRLLGCNDQRGYCNADACNGGATDSDGYCSPGRLHVGVFMWVRELQIITRACFQVKCSHALDCLFCNYCMVRSPVRLYRASRVRRYNCVRSRVPFFARPHPHAPPELRTTGPHDRSCHRRKEIAGVSSL